MTGALEGGGDPAEASGSRLPLRGAVPMASLGLS